MPNNRRSTLKKINGKESVHPGSRKAAQINRVHLRSAKLKSQAKARKDLKHGKMFRPYFFMQSLESSDPLTLEQLRAMITDQFIARHDERIAELEAERRAGRPKCKELVELEEIRRIETREWETGFEVPNLMDARATRLMFGWVENGTRIQSSHINLLPWVRLAKDTPDVVVTSRKGALDGMGLGQLEAAAAGGMAVDSANAAEGEDAAMEE